MSKLQSDRYPFHNSENHYREEYLKDKITTEELSRKVESKAVSDLASVERELERYKESGFKLERIKDKLLKSGNRTWSVENAVDSVIDDAKNKVLNKNLVCDLKSMINLCNKILSSIKEELENEHGG